MTGIWSEAIEEAYALVPADIEPWETLEIRHPALDEPARFVLDHGEKIGETDEDEDGHTQDIYGRMLTLEGDAPVNAGETVAFIATAFEVRQPESAEGRAPEMGIILDNVPGDLMASLGPAAASGQKVDLIYREYLSDDPDTVHYRLTGLTMRRVSVTMLRIEGRISFGDLFRKSFPNDYYNARENATLAGA